MLAVIVASSMVAVACSSAPSEGPPDTTYGEYPLEELAGEGAMLHALLSVREDEFVSECMTREGFAYFPRRVDPSDNLSGVLRPELTIARAQEYGYRMPEVAARSGSNAATENYLEGLDGQGREEWGVAFGGTGAKMVSAETPFGLLSTPADGCLAEARAAIAGDVETHLRWAVTLNQIETLLGQASERAEADRAVQDAVDGWRTCMQTEGFDVDHPREAIELAWSRDGAGVEDIAEPSEWEVTVAVADATCRDASGYRAIAAERRSHYENVILAENEQILFEWDESRTRLREILNDLLARQS